jgi:hypothetical protein
MNADVETMPKLLLSEHLEKWEKRIAKQIGVPTIWKRQAADLLSAVAPTHEIPAQTYRNWFYRRRLPSALAEFEVIRRTKAIEDHISGARTVPALAQVIADIQTEHANGDREED